MDPSPPTPETLIGIGAATALIGSTVVSLTQLTKRLLPGDAWGPYLALVWSIVGVAVWLYSQPNWPPPRSDAFSILAAWAVVFGFASGLYRLTQLPSEQIPGLRALFARPRKRPARARARLGRGHPARPTRKPPRATPGRAPLRPRAPIATVVRPETEAP